MKALISFCVLVFATAFAYIPYLWGDDNFFGGWSILCSTIGGFFGIWVAVKIHKRWMQ